MVVEPIRWIVYSPLLQWIVHSRVFNLCFRFVVKPLLWTAAAWWFLPPESNRWASAGMGAAVFFTFNLLLNSRVGRTLEELVADWIAQAWRRFGVRTMVGIFWFFVDLFKRLLQTVERLIYTVDEWLRFRAGQGRASLVAKGALGLLWFFAAYVLRFAVNVLYEPQLNPIKHFPVVTVAHKILFPFYYSFARRLEPTMGTTAAWAVSFAVIWSIPGIPGFLVWELKENWRLYAANRRRELHPVMIGSHGENMSRLLKPGFHSGTLPKRFAKLRRAERHARRDGNWRSVHKHLRALEHAELSIRRYVEREFLELLAESRCWQLPPIKLERVRLGTNSMRLWFACPAFTDGPVQIAIAAQSGWLLAGVANPGWLGRLLPQQRQVLVTAIVGLYKSAGIDLVHEQIESEFPPPVPWYDVSAEGLIVGPTNRGRWKSSTIFRTNNGSLPGRFAGCRGGGCPPSSASGSSSAPLPLTWRHWVEAWNQDLAGQGHPRDGVIPACVLPPV